MQRQLQHKTIFVAALFLYLGLVASGAAVTVSAQEATLNSRPFTDLANNLAQMLDEKKVDLTKPFEVKVLAELDKDGRLQKPTYSYKGDDTLAKLVMNFVSAANDSNLLTYLKPLCANENTCKVAITISQNESVVALNLSTSLKDEFRTRQVASVLNTIVQYEAMRQRYTDKDSAAILQALKVVSEGNNVAVLYSMPRQIALDLLQHKLAKGKSENQDNNQEQEEIVFNCGFFDQFKQLTKLYNGRVNKNLPLRFAYQLYYSEGKPITLQVSATEGNPKTLSFIQKSVERCNPQESESTSNDKPSDAQKNSPYLQSLAPKNASYDYKADDSGVIYKVVFTFSSQDAAKTHFQIQNDLLERGRRVEPEYIGNTFNDKASMTFVNHTVITAENDQVFIVTRLPRAGLDLLLKANEKAN